jgi:PAS domain S-box-containing protein
VTTPRPPVPPRTESLDSPRRTAPFFEGLVAVAVASVLSWFLRHDLAATRLLLFWVASAYTAWRGGLWPTIVASRIGVVLANYTTTEPFGGFTRPTAPELFSATVFLFVTTLLGATFDRLRRARAQAELTSRELEEAGRQLQEQAIELEHQLEESQVMAEELEQTNEQLGELSASNEHARAQLEQAADGMSDAMLVFDSSWRLVFGNAAAATLLKRVGKDVRALQGRIVWDDLPLLAAEEMQSVLRGAAIDKRVVEQDLRYEPADLWLHVRGVPTADGGLATFIQDRTVARNAELARDRTDQRYRALVEASTVLVWTADPTGAVDDMPFWRELTGQDPQAVRGHGWLDAVHPADRESVRTRWTSAVASAKAYESDFRLRLRDGAHRWFHCRAVPIRTEGRIVEWVGVFEDTHDAHVEAERRAAVENSLSVLGSSLDYEWTLAAITRLVVPSLADYCSVDLVEPDGSIRRVSTTHVDPEKEEIVRVMWKRYPYQPTERLGVPEVIRTGQPQVMASIEPSAVERFARDAEHARMLAALGARSYACLPMTARGHTFGALSFVYSDSGRQYDEADVNAAQEIAARAANAIDNARLYAAAQTANRAKSEFLATMSHELRTPLNAIAGYAELLAMGVRGPVNEEQLRDLSRIQQNQQHLLEIITDILNFSRIEAGRVRYVLAPVPVRDVLARMEGMIEPQARARSIEYDCENVADGVAVLADREKLEQVLINLLGNAVKFTPSGGRITLSAVTDGDRVRLHVHDTGIGIEPAQIGSIFEPFVQLEPALTRTTEGAGLGLAISRELARGMGGELGVTSSPGAGSTFTVELPRAATGDQLVG